MPARGIPQWREEEPAILAMLPPTHYLVPWPVCNPTLFLLSGTVDVGWGGRRIFTCLPFCGDFYYHCAGQMTTAYPS